MPKAIRAQLSLIVVLGVGVLGGCASVVHSDGRTVLIEHGTGASKQAIEQARAECARYGKSIEFLDMRCPGQCISNFACVPTP